MKTVCIIFSLSLLSCNSPQRNSKINIPEGGYNFAEPINIKDSSFPFYPVRSMETIMDSTFDAFYTKKLLEVFEESNISLRPEKKPVFRIIFSEWTRPSYFIRIDEDQIIIKKGLRVDYLHKDEERLSELERQHLDILERGVPLLRRLKLSRPSVKRYLDSLTRLYPELLKEEYYDYLMQKAFTPLDKPFTYSTKIISIEKSIFNEIVSKLKNSNYWSLPLSLETYGADHNSIINEPYELKFSESDVNKDGFKDIILSGKIVLIQGRTKSGGWYDNLTENGKIIASYSEENPFRKIPIRLVFLYNFSTGHFHEQEDYSKKFKSLK
jgi:hypothetical protein